MGAHPVLTLKLSVPTPIPSLMSCTPSRMKSGVTIQKQLQANFSNLRSFGMLFFFFRLICFNGKTGKASLSLTRCLRIYFRFGHELTSIGFDLARTIFAF